MLSFLSQIFIELVHVETKCFYWYIQLCEGIQIRLPQCIKYLLLIVPTAELIQRANVTPFNAPHLFPSQLNHKSEGGEEMPCIWVSPRHVTKCPAALYMGAEKCLWLSSFRHSHCHFPACCTSKEGEFLSSCNGSQEAAATS